MRFLTLNCSILPIKKQTPTKNHTELATSCHVSEKEDDTKLGTTIKPRNKQIKEIVTRAGFKNGIFRIKPALENEYAVQANIKLAMITAPIGANNVPCLDDSINTGGALAKTSQLGPPIIQSKCQIADNPAIIPPVIRNLDLMLNFNANSIANNVRIGREVYFHRICNIRLYFVNG